MQNGHSKPVLRPNLTEWCAHVCTFSIVTQIVVKFEQGKLFHIKFSLFMILKLAGLFLTQIATEQVSIKVALMIYHML